MGYQGSLAGPSCDVGIDGKRFKPTLNTKNEEGSQVQLQLCILQSAGPAHIFLPDLDAAAGKQSPQS